MRISSTLHRIGVAALGVLASACQEHVGPDPAPLERNTIDIVVDSVVSLFDRKTIAIIDRVTAGPIPNESVIVRSSNPQIVAVSSGPPWVIQGLRVGTATIEVRRTADTLDVDRAVVRVGPMVIYQPASTTMEVTTAALPSVMADGSPLAPVRWESSNSSVLSIDGPLPTVKAVGLGTAVLTVIANGDATQRASKTITVTQAPYPVSGITLEPPSGVIRGTSMTTSAFVSVLAYGRVVTDRKPTITPDVAGVAVVDRRVADTTTQKEYSEEVVFRPIGVGAVKFTLAVGGQTAVFTVTVRPGGPDTVFTGTGRPTSFSVNANDIVSSASVVTGILPPTQGTAVLLNSSGSMTYTGNTGFVGADSLSYILNSRGVVDTVPVQILVMPGAYSATPINPDATVTATDLSQAGEVTGSLRLGSGPERAFRWSIAGNTLLPVPSSTDGSTATAINDLGDIVGRLNSRAALWRNGAAAPIVLDTADAFLFPVDINNRVEVAFRDSFRIWRNGRMDSVGRVGDCTGLAALNNRGDYVIEGCGSMLTYTRWRVQLAAGGFYENSCYPGRYRFLTNFNDSAWVVSREEDQRFGGGVKPALHFRLNSCVRLTERYDSHVVTAVGLNNRGWVTGELALANGKTSAVLLLNGVTIPLDQLAPMQGWSYVSARRVNDAGQILAHAIEDATGRRGTFLLSPQP